MQDWRMSRVTVGIICSPFLATQVLRQVALADFPTVEYIINYTFYVDDCVMGASTVEEAVHIQEDLTALVSKACMTLRKCRSNSADLLITVPEELHEKEEMHLHVLLLSA